MSVNHWIIDNIREYFDWLQFAAIGAGDDATDVDDVTWFARQRRRRRGREQHHRSRLRTRNRLNPIHSLIHSSNPPWFNIQISIELIIIFFFFF